MKKYPLIGGSILAVVLLIFGSLTNVVGFQTVQSSNQKIINEGANQRELLFQTIVDIANNKEIQQIILKSQMSRGILPTSDIPILTKNQLNRMYIVGLMLSKSISKSKMYSMIERFQGSNQEIQNKINAVMKKDSTLNREITQLSILKCDCENENMTSWTFPTICLVLYFLFWLSYIFWITHINTNLVFLIGDIGKTLNCFWSSIAP